MGASAPIFIFIQVAKQANGRTHVLLAISSVFYSIILIAAISDLATYRIPNAISYALITLFLIAITFLHPPISIIGWHVLTGLIAFSIGAAVFYLGRFGGGDVKLIAALALLIGYQDIVPFLLIMSIAGGALTLVLIVIRALPLPQKLKHYNSIMELHDKKNGVPYGVAIAVGAAFTWPNTQIYSLLST